MSEFALPDGIVGSDHLGVRVFCVATPGPQQLADQIARSTTIPGVFCRVVASGSTPAP
jgi:hypothetical protein